MTKRIGLVLSGPTHYDPGVRDFLLFAKGLQDLGHPVTAFGLNLDSAITQHVESKLLAANVVECSNFSQLAQAVRREHVELIVADDWPSKLELLRRLRRDTGVRTVAYAIYLRGIQLIREAGGNPSIPARLKDFTASAVPFRLFTSRYRTLLRDVDYVVADSVFCEILVTLLYGRRPDGIAYCPIDDSTFPGNDSSTSHRDGALVFLGGPFDRAPSDYIRTLELLASRGMRLKLLGERRFADFVLDRLGSDRVEAYRDLSDLELKRLYSSVEMTYLPQYWETFGTAGPESLLCETPVVTDIGQPLLEVIGGSPAVRIARGHRGTNDAFSIPFGVTAEDWSNVKRALLSVESPRNSAAALLRAIDAFVPPLARNV